MCVMEEKVLIEVGRYVKFDRVCEGIFKDTGCDSFWRLCIIIYVLLLWKPEVWLWSMEIKIDGVWLCLKLNRILYYKECGSVFWIVYFQTF